jgi:Zn finger protein HypA/HybF involved in hydrogenase expression
MVNKIDLLSDSEFAKLISNCYSISDVLKSLGYSVNGNSWGFRIVKERMEKLGLFFIKKPKDLHSALTKDSSYNRTKLKERLFKEGLKEYKCELCGISEWNGKPLSLQLHHINGVNNDNRLSNLQILCPNCHSQTDNFSSKGKGTSIIRKADNLSRENVELIMNTVREYGIVEARKRLTFRNSLINAVVKYHRDIIVMITPDNSEKEFATTVEAARYIFNTLHKGTSVESVRSRISDCLSGKQKTTAGGYKFYRRSIGV